MTALIHTIDAIGFMVFAVVSVPLFEDNPPARDDGGAR